MRLSLFCLLGLAACGFDHGSLAGGGATGGIDSGSGGGSDSGSDADTSACAWSYMPTNFMPCALPAPQPLHVTAGMLFDPTTTTLPKLSLTQNDGSPLTVIHLSTFAIDAGVSFGVGGPSAVVFAVDGDVDLSGTLVVSAGNDESHQCGSGMRGGPGADSTDSNSGAGGGGGGGGDENGGDGGKGSGSNAGAKGAKGSKVTSTLSPLRGGCSGGAGGKFNQAGSGAEPGRGGGALQISSDGTISVAFTAFIDASGRGGTGGVAHVGGGGGGSGGGIFFEAPTMQLDFAARLCADGGSGGNGGGSGSTGNDGRASPCNGASGATTIAQTSFGGDGGAGGYVFGSAGVGTDAGGSDGAGAGGGGGVGWIRLKSPGLMNSGAITTPAYTTN